jgi:hypothetical protein
MVDPFTASFGVSPPLLVGRDALLDEFEAALLRGPGASGRATLYTGARGSGKTVMLNAVEDRARAAGWLVISETASSGFLQRVVGEHLPAFLREFDPKAVQRRLRGVTGPMSAGAVTWDSVERHVLQAGLRSQLALLTDLLAEHQTGVLITVDEIHRKHIDELRELAVTVQHMFRESREVAFVGAGLASAVTDLVNDDVITFLRRADRHHLDRVPRSDVERGLREPIEAAGRSIAPSALELMVDACDGYPFMLQLVGTHTWGVHPDQRVITDDDAAIGTQRARERLATLIFEPALRTTSKVDRSFLQAMAQDDGPTELADVTSRLRVSASYASQYRLRLIAAELIEPVGLGLVDFALPYLREYLRTDAAGAGPRG